MSTRLDESYARQVAAIRARVTAFASARFRAGQYRDADAARFVGQVVPVVLAGRKQVSQLTDAYLAFQLTQHFGRPVKPQGMVDTSMLRGVEPNVVYNRPFVEVRTKLSQGASFDAAVKAGAERLVDIAATDMQLAKTTTARDVYRSAGVERFLRVPSGNSCALCLIASTQTYSTDDLMPIHPGCNCGVDVAPGNFDGAQMLQDVHAAVQDKLGTSDAAGRAVDYRKILVTHDHGEIGPVLAVRGQHFTGPASI